MYWIPSHIKTLVTIRYALIHMKTSLLDEFSVVLRKFKNT